mmetsp:Transcript_7469/g.8181  ORF Transcript_7469/g.8181 Transcript_7469/m.8181 type:complete len:129 (-) Transcript_7469:14-400(-)
MENIAPKNRYGATPTPHSDIPFHKLTLGGFRAPTRFIVLKQGIKRKRGFALGTGIWLRRKRQKTSALRLDERQNNFQPLNVIHNYSRDRVVVPQNNSQGHHKRKRSWGSSFDQNKCNMKRVKLDPLLY